MDLSIEFDFDHKIKKENNIWNLFGKCLAMQIHPDEKEFEKRITKLLPENIKSKYDIEKITINGKDFDSSKSLFENQIKQGAIIVLTIKIKV